MKISSTASTILVLSGAAFSLSLKATQEGIETSVCDWCCVIEPPLHPPFLGFEYWSEVGTVLFVLSFGFVLAFFKVLIEDNRKSDVLHITPTN